MASWTYKGQTFTVSTSDFQRYFQGCYAEINIGNEIFPAAILQCDETGFSYRAEFDGPERRCPYPLMIVQLFPNTGYKYLLDGRTLYGSRISRRQTYKAANAYNFIFHNNRGKAFDIRAVGLLPEIWKTDSEQECKYPSEFENIDECWHSSWRPVGLIVSGNLHPTSKRRYSWKTKGILEEVPEINAAIIDDEIGRDLQIQDHEAAEQLMAQIPRLLAQRPSYALVDEVQSCIRRLGLYYNERGLPLPPGLLDANVSVNNMREALRLLGVIRG